MPSDQGYAKARELLEQTFGQKFQIAKACVDSLANGPGLNQNDKATLIEFSAKLNSCMHTLIGMNYLHKMDNLDVVTKIAKRLPHQWLSGWQSTVDTVIHIQKQEVSIHHLAEFVSLKTRQTTNFECDWSNFTKRSDFKSSRNANVAKSGRREITMAMRTDLNSDSIKIKRKLCKETHYLNQCNRFRKLRYNDRRKFVIESKLCWSCLSGGHFAKACQRTNSCKKPGCTGSHITLLHPPDPPPAAADSNGCSPENVEVRNGFVDIPSETKNFLPIVPVQVCLSKTDDVFEMHAFLDTRSTTSFITNDLLEKLNVKDSPTVDVSTVTINPIPEKHKAKVVSNLEISGINESTFLSLQSLLSIKQIPVLHEDIPTQDDVEQFPEFGKLYIPSIEAGVGLLIGNDNRHILQPYQILNSSDGHYALRSNTGWIVNCSKKNGRSSQSKKFFSQNAPYSTSKQPICSLCLDVVDSIQNVNEFSRDQKQFVTKGVQHHSTQQRSALRNSVATAQLKIKSA